MKYVAFLRGINVGGNNKIEMSRLKEAFVSLWYKDVSTYINSGNVIFNSEKTPSNLTREIETKILEVFGLKIRVTLRDTQNIQKLCESIPESWQNNAEQKTDILFLWDEFYGEKSLELIEKNPEIDTLIYCDGAIIWYLEKKYYNQSKMGDFIKTKLYKYVTVRNVNTLRKLAKLL